MSQAEESPFDLVCRSYDGVDTNGSRSYEFVMRNDDCVYAFFNDSLVLEKQKSCQQDQLRPRHEYQVLLDQIQKHGHRLPDQVLLSNDL
ncbi:MAG: hypothetical protein SCABRO_00670 [Candidatus Scalindua brodae]|uniref:Uncharacterized protein n=1 Tax=Candidatus Scalindua brodae TaxID=237368 RepID=A0A0B0ESH3_9BACT|nr:MAG: hypothetical protein SCABRO_00670 [Candidatus Scalindua brodae]